MAYTAQLPYMVGRDVTCRVAAALNRWDGLIRTSLSLLLV